MAVHVNSYHVEKAKELYDNSPGKSNHKDLKTIAMLVKDGCHRIPYIPKVKYTEF